MRVPMIMTIDFETSKEIRETAASIGVPMSRLADLFLRMGLGMSRSKLEAWAASRREAARAVLASRSHTNRLTVSESRTLALLGVDWRQFKGAPGAVLWRSLLALEAAGLVERDSRSFDGPKTARGFIMHTSWRLAAVAAS